MATNVIKSLKYDTYEGKFTGIITINLATEVDGNIITEDGVFGVGKTNKIRVNVSYLMAMMRNHEVHGAALSVWLDALKANPLPLRQASWASALMNQEIDVEPVLKDADEEHAEQWYSHDVKIVTISKGSLMGAYSTMVSVTNPWLTDPKMVMEQAKELIAAVEAE